LGRFRTDHQQEHTSSVHYLTIEHTQKSGHFLTQSRLGTVLRTVPSFAAMAGLILALAPSNAYFGSVSSPQTLHFPQLRSFERTRIMTSHQGPSTKEGTMQRTKADAKPAPAWAGRIPHIKPGTYSDGLPLHELEYLSCKLILKPNRFTSRKSLFAFAKVLKQPADLHGVAFSSGDYIDQPTKVREVLFVDTPDFRFYNNAFILRRRVQYEDGFPVEYSRGTPRQIQVSGAAAQGEAWRNPHALLPQCPVSALTRRQR